MTEDSFSLVLYEGPMGCIMIQNFLCNELISDELATLI